MPDAYIIAHHQRDLLDAASINQLSQCSAEPDLLPRISSGPDRGKSRGRLSMEVLQDYSHDRDAGVRVSARIELEKCGEAGGSSADELAQGSFL